MRNPVGFRRLRYILNSADVKGCGCPSETFRVLKEKETHQHGEYRTRLEAWNRMEAQNDFTARCDHNNR